MDPLQPAEEDRRAEQARAVRAAPAGAERPAPIESEGPQPATLRAIGLSLVLAARRTLRGVRVEVPAAVPAG